jgi:ADP-ribose pyrophosphatase
MTDERNGQGGEGEPGLVRSRHVYRGRTVDLSVDTVRFPDGSAGELDMVRHPGAAAVLPVLSGAGSADPVVVLIRQYRYAAGGYLYEVPAGKPDTPGEPWEDVARRELEEETGLRAGALRYLTAIYTAPGFTDERIHLYVASDLAAGAVSREADEFIETVRLPLSRALEMVRDGEITDAKTMCTLLYAAGFVFGL